ncbi:hypothetical protein U5907_08010 [Bacteroidales bacterium MB20-C3-3]|nr:hypothetical protein U5907_08010 [Bacteroidales bacterium MB20-C3-3]
MNRSSVYYKPVEESSEELDLMLKMDKEYHEHPTYGSYDHLSRENLSNLGMAKYIHSYKLRGLDITHSNQVWGIDITHIPMERGSLYLTAIIDVYSRRNHN